MTKTNIPTDATEQLCHILVSQTFLLVIFFLPAAFLLWLFPVTIFPATFFLTFFSVTFSLDSGQLPWYQFGINKKSNSHLFFYSLFLSVSSLFISRSFSNFSFPLFLSIPLATFSLPLSIYYHSFFLIYSYPYSYSISLYLTYSLPYLSLFSVSLLPPPLSTSLVNIIRRHR